MKLAYMPKSKSDVHITPDRVFDLIEDYWGYSKINMFDPCPVDPDFDGLGIDWKELNFVNPPYSHLKDFVYYAIDQTFYKRKTVMLLPSKTDQSWFHHLLSFHYEILWIQKRLKFKNNLHHSMQSHFLVKITYS
jgi:hypothetical protein